MSPVGRPARPAPGARRRPSRRSAAAALTMALGGVAAAVVLFVGITNLASRGKVEVRLGDDRFEVGDARSWSAKIADKGPLLFADPAGRARDVWVNHLGEDPLQGWVAFEARPAGASRDCSVRWSADSGGFENPCTGDRYPPDGGTLARFPVAIEGGRVRVDINYADRPAETTTPASPASSVVESGIPKTTTTAP
ncbi:MAG: hypothetical protein ACKVWR_20715 [Acidimicrobiales bacterium]